MNENTTDRLELAKQIFEHSCAKNGYAYDWSKQDIKTIQQWTTVADFVLEREVKLRAELEAAKEELKQRDDMLSWLFEKSNHSLPILLRKIDRKEGVDFGIDKYTMFGIKLISGWHKTPLEAIQAAIAALKEGK